MFTRASNKHPMYHESLHLCLEELVQTLINDGIKTIHFPVVDTERPCNNIETWYRVLTDHFTDTGIQVVLHDRVYVSIATIAEHFPPPLSDDFDLSDQLPPVPNNLKSKYASSYFKTSKEIPDPSYKDTIYKILSRRTPRR